MAKKYPTNLFTYYSSIGSAIGFTNGVGTPSDHADAVGGLGIEEKEDRPQESIEQVHGAHDTSCDGRAFVSGRFHNESDSGRG